jgi:hypothetical protein
MPKWSIRARCEIAAITVLLLGSCSGSQRFNAGDAYDLADVARANSVNALAAVEALESRVAKLEAKANESEGNIIVLFSNAEADRSTANDNAKIINRSLDRLDAVEARLGM